MKLLANVVFSVSLAVPVASVMAAPVVLVDETFENPTEVTYDFPAPQGSPTLFHGEFNAWTREGLIKVTYGAGLGYERSGGMACTLTKPSALFMLMNYNRIALPINDPAYTTVEQIKTYVLSFDAKIPAGKKIDISLNPRYTDAELRPRADSSKLTLGRVTGTGEYVRYTLPASVVAEQGVRNFLQFIRDISLNGETKLMVDIQWTLLGRTEVWAAGEVIQVDNIKMTAGN